MGHTDTGFREWLHISTAKLRRHGIEGVKDVFYDLYRGAWRLGWCIPRGTNVYERDWDILIILDACRTDLLHSVADEYTFLNTIDEIASVGSMSEEWMAKTFTDRWQDEMEQTSLITANVFSDTTVSDDMFQQLDEVWRYAWDDDTGTVPPRPITDRVIQTAREDNPEKIIAHYIQPHHPFIQSNHGFDGATFGPTTHDTIIDALRKGKISRQTFWEEYQDNLRLVLDDIELLLANIDADTVAITADHGDALGEWGIYGHPAGCLHPAVTNVPWVETSADDSGTYEPETTRSEDDHSVRERLRSLGYY